MTPIWTKDHVYLGLSNPFRRNGAPALVSQQTVADSYTN
jgi:hypothetical protein